MAFNQLQVRRVQSLPGTLQRDTMYFVEQDATNCDYYVTDNASPPNARLVSQGPQGETGDAYESYAVSIYKSDGIETGGYYADRRANAASTQEKIYVEIIDGDPGSEIDIYLEVDGAPAYGPFTVEYGTPVSLSALSVAVAADDPVNWVITAIMGGDVRDVFAKSYGAVS